MYTESPVEDTTKMLFLHIGHGFSQGVTNCLSSDHVVLKSHYVSYFLDIGTLEQTVAHGLKCELEIN